MSNAREIEDVADTFFCMGDKYANFEDYYFACYGALEKLLEQAYNEGKAEREVAGADLATAKEIIRDLLGCLYAVGYSYITDLEEAERFLNEEE